MCEVKECSKCKRDLPKTNEYYFNNSKTKDGLMSQCKECMGYKFQDFKNKYKCSEGFKICRRCNRELPLNHDHFYYNKVSLDGYDYSCRECEGYKFGKSICKDGYKICGKCEIELPLNKENFHVDKSNSDGFDNFCKDCKFNRNVEEFNIFDWYKQRSGQFKTNWSFDDIKWMFDNYQTISKQELLDYFNGEKNYKTLTNIIYQWNVKKKEKNDNWSKDDVKFLKENYPNMRQIDLESHFKGRTWVAIKIKANKLNIYRDEETLFLINSESHKGVPVSEEAKRKIGLAHRGSKNWNWKGGVSPLHPFLRDKLDKWKFDSLEFYNFKCVITGKNDGTLHVHHLSKNFSEIIQETFNNLSLPINSDMTIYTEEELLKIQKEFVRLHYHYGLGVPILAKLHTLFHSVYGNRCNTYEQFEEFKRRYLDGEFNEQSEKAI